MVSALARSTCARNAIMALRPFCTSSLYFSFSAGRVNSCRCECGAATAPTKGIVISCDRKDWSMQLRAKQRLPRCGTAYAVGSDASGRAFGVLPSPLWGSLRISAGVIQREEESRCGEIGMSERDQLSLSEALMSPAVGRNEALERLARDVKCYRFEKLLGRLKPEGAGRPPFDPLLMFKALLLQQWYHLSDAELEEALNDRMSFRRFLGLSLEDASPDHTTLCRVPQPSGGSGPGGEIVCRVRAATGAAWTASQARHDDRCDAGGNAVPARTGRRSRQGGHSASRRGRRAD